MPEVVVNSNLIQLSSPVDVDALVSLPLNSRIQFGGFGWAIPTLTEADFRKLGQFIERRPDVTLRAFHLGADDDLEFLRFFPKLRRVWIDPSYSLARFEGLRHLPQGLEALSFGGSKKPVSLRFLEQFKGLRQLWLEGHSKDIDAISTLTDLEHLSISSITLSDLSIFLPLKKLSRFEITLGGTKNLGLLPQLGRIHRLGLYMVKGLEDISPIGGMEFLEHLILNTLNRVAALPSLKLLRHLKRVELTNVKSVTDLSPLLQATQLEELLVEKSSHLDAPAFECLKNHPSLKRLSAYVGRKKANAAIKAMIGLPDVLDDRQ